MSADVPNQIPIFTIGYGQRDVEALLTDLRAHDIHFLIDVRSQPYSRYKPDFNKETLAQHLEAAGIRYVFMGDTLGGRPDTEACYTDGKVDYDKVAQQGFYQSGIGRLREAHQQQQRVALMCSEGKPEQCHRAKLIGRSLTELSIPVAHIDENGRLITQADVILHEENGQPSLFDAIPNPMGESDDTSFSTADPGAPPPPPNFESDDFSDWQPPADADWDQSDAYTPILNAQLSRLEQYDDPAAALRQVFGYDSFRPLQQEIISGVLDGQDALAVMPTGSGKSLCYQLPALLFPGLTVVVSPLISLMEDQVMQLRELGVPAAALNSSLSYADYQWTVDQIRNGRVKLLYAAPETLLRPETLLLLEQVRVDCFTIDEAHCISEWGHDFRPEYRQLSDVRRRLPDAVCLAATATATERVRGDIKASLDIDDGGEFIASFNRENLFLAVEPKTDTLAQTLAFLGDHRDEAGIIYCATRRQVDELTAQLQAHGWGALPYHAGLDTPARQRHQHRFSRDDTSIIVATIAFGMGINKSNVRFILHVDLPKNLESYYQQIGRAGRDGLRADCLLLYSYGDVNTINYFISQQAESQQIGARLRLEAMLGFVEANGCRRRPLLAYFNESYSADTCDMCDNCTTAQEDLVDLTIPAQKFLSCVKRTGEIFGVNHIIDVLRGSRAKKVLQKGHDRLSTYDIGGEFSKKQWQYLARQFVQQDLLVQDMEYGSLKLTQKAYAVFRGEEQVWGTMMEPARRETAAAPSAAPPHDANLFQILRAHRKALADAANVPPYVIFSDRTLVEMAAYFPQSRQRFASLYGVGAAKLEKYADEFLPLIREYCTEHGIEEKRKAVTAGAATSSGKSRRQEVAELWNDGRSLTDIATHYQVKPRTILKHLWKAVQAGESLQPDGLLDDMDLPPDEQQRALDAFAAHGTDFLRPVYKALGETVPYDALHLLRLHFVLNNRS